MDIAAGGYPPDGFVYTIIYCIYAAYRIYRIYAAAYILYGLTLRLHTPKNLITQIWLGTNSKRRRFGLGRASSRVLIPAEPPPRILLAIAASVFPLDHKSLTLENEQHQG